MIIKIIFMSDSIHFELIMFTLYSIFLFFLLNTHTHTHTHIYIYFFIVLIFIFIFVMQYYFLSHFFVYIFASFVRIFLERIIMIIMRLKRLFKFK